MPPPPGETHIDELHDIGFALAKSALLISALSDGTHNGIEMALTKDLKDACSEEDRIAFEEAAQLFFCKKKITGLTEHGSEMGIALTTGQKSAWCVKSKAEITDAWQQIFERRRLQERDDTAPINDPHVLRNMYTDWMNHWLSTELTQGQTRSAVVIFRSTS